MVDIPPDVVISVKNAVVAVVSFVVGWLFRHWFPSGE